MLSILPGMDIPFKKIAALDLPPPPGAGDYWDNTTHAQIVDAIRNAVIKTGGKPDQERYYLARKKYDMFGNIDLVHPDISVPDGMTLFIGIRTSMARRCRTRLAAGVYQPLTGIGFIIGEAYVGIQHNGRADRDIKADIKAALPAWMRLARGIEARYDAMVATDLGMAEACKAMVMMARRNVIPWTFIREIDAHFRKPTVDRNLWELMVGVCIGIGESSVPAQFVRHLAASEFMENMIELRKGDAA